MSVPVPSWSFSLGFLQASAHQLCLVAAAARSDQHITHTQPEKRPELPQLRHKGQDRLSRRQCQSPSHPASISTACYLREQVPHVSVQLPSNNCHQSVTVHAALCIVSRNLLCPNGQQRTSACQSPVIVQSGAKCAGWGLYCGIEKGGK